jgi:predicted DNA-binding protein with PD1-like motif
MRTLQHPGPVHEQRIDSLRGAPIVFEYVLQPGRTLSQALTAPLVKAGLRGGTIAFSGGALSPFRYVMPGPPDSDAHVAYFSAPRAPAGITRIDRANATFGWQADKPAVHVHGVWIEPDGARRGGHMLPNDCIVAEPVTAQACGFAEIIIAAEPDAETNFTLFQIAGTSATDARAVAARVHPNEDITLAVEALARGNGMRDAVVRGSLGSLVGAQFTDGRAVEDHATEVLIRSGVVRGGVAELDMLVVDMNGRVHEGTLLRGENAVCITFDLVLEAAS